MTSLRPHTKLYPAEARKRLGIAITRAREAAGYPYRPALAETAGLSVRSILKLEQGEPVGPAVYEAVARVLPGWNEDTPRLILEGAPAPALSDRSSRRPDQSPPPESHDAMIARVTYALYARGWSDDRVSHAISELEKDRSALPTVEQRSVQDG